MGITALTAERRPRRRTLLHALIAGIAALLMVFSASPAMAAGSRTFDGTFKVGVASTEFHTAAKGTISITSTGVQCPSSKVYVVTLQKFNGLGWANNGSFSLNCTGASEKYNWTGRPAGHYRVWFSKTNNGQYMRVTGKLTYP